MPTCARAHSTTLTTLTTYVASSSSSASFLCYNCRQVRVLFLADGWLPGGDAGPLAAAAKEAGLGDGLRWTVKSIARDDTTGTYLMFAAYQTFAFAFTSASPTTANSFAPSIKSASGNFDDHVRTSGMYRSYYTVHNTMKHWPTSV